MFIEKVNIVNFRNYENQIVVLSPHINIFVGDNAQGKTNLLEALYLSSVGRSPRTPRDRELIRWGEDKATIAVKVNKKYGDEKVEMVIDKSANKRIALNGMPITKIGELMGVVGTVFFSPDEMKIIKDAPGDRRRFMDIAICQLSQGYFYLLGRFNKTLSQRNKLLKSGKATADSLDVWDMQLAEAGAKVTKNRLGFIEKLSAFAALSHEFLTDGKEQLLIRYEGIGGENYEEIYDKYLAALKNSRERDIALCYTNIGAQKDDLAVLSNGVDLRSFGSQGQQRTASLSMKLAELELHNEIKGEYPVLLLDDVLSELDKSRQEKLMEKLSGFQTVITCTDYSEEIALSRSAAVFKVTSGKAVKIK